MMMPLDSRQLCEPLHYCPINIRARYALGKWGDLSIGGDGPLDAVHRDQLTRLRVDAANFDFLQKLASRLRAREIMTLPSLKPELP